MITSVTWLFLESLENYATSKRASVQIMLSCPTCIQFVNLATKLQLPAQTSSARDLTAFSLGHTPSAPDRVAYGQHCTELATDFKARYKRISSPLLRVWFWVTAQQMSLTSSMEWAIQKICKLQRSSNSGQGSLDLPTVGCSIHSMHDSM
eukprot:3191040-Amphidinium_carterae.2